MIKNVILCECCNVPIKECDEDCCPFCGSIEFKPIYDEIDHLLSGIECMKCGHYESFL